MKKIICKIFGHKRGRTYLKEKWWHIQCKRCGYKIDYQSPFVRLIGKEMLCGFDGN